MHPGAGIPHLEKQTDWFIFALYLKPASLTNCYIIAKTCH